MSHINSAYVKSSSNSSDYDLKNKIFDNVTHEKAKSLHARWCKDIKCALKKGVERKDGSLEFGDVEFPVRIFDYLKYFLKYNKSKSFITYYIDKDFVDHMRETANSNWDKLSDYQKFCNLKIAKIKIIEEKAKNCESFSMYREYKLG